MQRRKIKKERRGDGDDRWAALDSHRNERLILNTFQVCKLCPKQHYMEQMWPKPPALRKWGHSHGDEAFDPCACTQFSADSAKASGYITIPHFLEFNCYNVYFYLYPERILTQRISTLFFNIKAKLLYIILTVIRVTDQLTNV